jgi:glycosyltransferase involved in cell wall biosynthesis
MNSTFKKIKNILYVYSSGKKVEWLWQYMHFFSELKDYGIEFIPFNIENYKTNYEDVLLKQIKNNHQNISLFMTELNDYQISEAALAEIKKIGIPMLLICYDNLTIPFVHQKIASCFDLTWVTSFETEHILKKTGAKTVFLPYASNPTIFYPSYSNEIPSVGFTGSLYGSRIYKIAAISNNSIPVNVYTAQHISNNTITHEVYKSSENNFPFKKRLIYDYNYLKFKEGRKILLSNYYKALKKRIEKRIRYNNFVSFSNNVPFNEMIRLYSNFALSLGITEVSNTYLLKNPLYKVHLRTFEIPMCGGLQITNRIPEIEKYFDDNKEIILYDSDEDMVEKMKFYLKIENESLRKKMKQAARLRAEKEHTWSNRFEKIENILFSQKTY